MPDLYVVRTAPLPHVVSVPTAPRDGPLPVLCFLHGFDEAAPLDVRVGVSAHGPLRPGSSPLATDRFLVVAPQLPRAGDHWLRYADAVRSLAAAARDEHGGDPERTYLTGFSYGGNGVFDLALAHPGEWAALWAVDPTRVPRRDPGRPVWLTVGEVARPRTAVFARTLGLAPPGAGADRIVLDEGDDHVGSGARAYSDDRIYHWLLRFAVGP